MADRPPASDESIDQSVSLRVCVSPFTIEKHSHDFISLHTVCYWSVSFRRWTVLGVGVGQQLGVGQHGFRIKDVLGDLRFNDLDFLDFFLDHFSLHPPPVCYTHR